MSFSAAPAADGPAEGEAAGIELFERKVRPLLADRCHGCHSAKTPTPKAGLLLDTRDGLLKGGKSGPAVVPGAPDRSLLIRAVRRTDRRLRMPPEDKDRLSAPEVADLEAWVRMGAPFPAPVAQTTTEAGEARRLWAFQPVRGAPVPKVQNGHWPRNPIDRFVLAKLEARGLAPAPAADKRTLIRRATFDLIGLPPTPEEVDAFLADDSPEAFAKVVDRLLASPHYGERWGRHWLDVVRYADTAGDASDYPVPQAYRYRNYVIRAFNQDKPYDRFLREQIAGDLLPAETVARQNRPLSLPRTKGPADWLAEALRDKGPAVRDAALKALEGVNPKGKVALPALEEAFQRGPEPVREAAAVALLSIDSAADDRLPGLAAVLERKAEMGGRYRKLLRRIKVAKDVDQYALFNDFGQADAYPVYEGHKNIPKGYWVYVYPYWYIWERTGRARRGNPELWRGLPDEEKYFAPASEQIIATGFLAIARRYGIYPEREPHLVIEDTLEMLGRSVLGLGLSCARCHDHKFDPITREDYYGLYGIFASTRYPTTGSEGIEGIPYQRFFVPLVPAEEAEAVLGPFQRKFGDLEDELERVREKRGDQNKLRARRNVFIAERPVVPNAYAVSEAAPLNARIQLRGDPRRLGPEVPRQFLQVLGGQRLPAGAPGSGRLQLADWLTDPRNPLTARVMVNRIWHHHFGKGLVPTPNDFGARGVPPTHPELLDYLAARFVAGGWSVKAMHRLLMLSRTYQLGNGDDLTANANADPNNDLFWRFNRRRLDAEAVRDAILWVSGELDLSPGGAHPFPAEHRWNYVCANPFSAVYETNRRSVYLMQARLRKQPFLELFDGANPNLSTGGRRASTTPVQALFMMNSPFVQRQAQKLAERLIDEYTDDRDRIRLAYRLALARSPRPDELLACESYLRQAYEKVRYAPVPPPWWERTAWATFAQVLLTGNEFLFVD